MNYKIFNLSIHSNIPLPELQTIQDHRNTNIYFQLSRKVDRRSISSSVHWFHHWKLPQGQISISAGKENNGSYRLHFPHLADFNVNFQNHQITANRLEEIPDETVRHLLLDQVVPRYLCHLGMHVIHAGCVMINKRAIVFSGESGWGKSTLCAYFYNQGYSVLTDDCVLLDLSGEHIVATANYPGIRHFNDINFLLPRINSVPVSHYSTKNRYPIDPTTTPNSLPLKTIVLLGNPKHSHQIKPGTLEPLSGANAVITLIKNSFSLDITDKQRAVTQLQTLAKILSHEDISVYQLNYPRKLDMLPQLAQMIFTQIQ